MNISIGFHFIIPQKHFCSSSAYKYYSYSFDLSAVITVFINFKLSYSRSLFSKTFLNKFTETYTETQSKTITLHFWNKRLSGHSVLETNVQCITNHSKEYPEFFLSMSSTTVLEQVLLIPMTHHQVWPFKFFLWILSSILTKVTFFSYLQSFCWC